MTQYDPLNRVKAQLSAYDPSDPAYNTAAETDYSYDNAGRLASVSAPPSGTQTLRNLTTYSYFDNGWTKTSTDPWDITTSYHYNPLGQQATRTITSAGGDLSRTMGWAYYPDGKLSSRSDDGVPTGLYSELVDDSDFQNVTATSNSGGWQTSSAGSGYVGYGYHYHTADNKGVVDTFTWHLNIPQDGNYTVYVKYPAVSGATTGAYYTVDYSGGSANVIVDQTKNTGTWVALGKWAFTQHGTGQDVILGDSPSAVVVADAVKVVRDNTGVNNTAHHDFGYSYDPNGNLNSITDTSQQDATITSYSVSYDGLDRLTKVLEQAAGVTQHTTTYGYDPAGNLTSRGHDAATSTYTYDPRNLLATETDATSATDPSPQVSAFTFDPKGLLSHEVKPNGNTVDGTYFADGVPQTQTENTSGGTLVSSHAYTYNPDGGKTSDAAKVMNADDNTAYLTHTYDPRDRIAAVTKDGTTTESYTHDASDNVTAQTIDGTNTTYNYDRDRLLTATTGGATADYNYDPSGRLDTVTGGGQILQQNTYDGFDHITAHQQQNSSGGTDTTTYTYDPLNRKTSQTTGGTTTQYAYLGLSSDLVTESSLGAVTKSYDYTPGGARLSQTTHNPDGSTAGGYYSYNDHSDVEAVTSQSGGTTATYGYTAYGQNDKTQFTGTDKNTATGTSTAQPFNPYRYNAMRWDSTTAQYDMGFRTYDPGLNQFLTRDMYNGALNDTGLSTDPFTGSRYTFGAGNPISNIELDGHTHCDAGICPTQRQINQVTALQQQDNPDLPILQRFGSGINAAAYAPNSGTYENALLAAQRGFQGKYGYLPASLDECAANRGGGMPACGGKEMLDVTTFLHDYLCKQHGITCLGPAATNSPFATALAAGAAAGMMFGGEGHQGEEGAGGGAGSDPRALESGYTEPTELHHVLPQQFRSQFENAGLNVDEATVRLPSSVHQAAHDVGWNSVWEDFFGANPNPSSAEIVVAIQPEWPRDGLRAEIG